MPFVDYILLNENDIDIIGIWKNDESLEDLLLELRPTGRLLEQFNQIELEKRQIEFCITHLLLKEILDKQVFICKDEYGKPSIENSNLKISISHADAYSAVCLSEELECGIDVEIIDPRMPKLAKRFVSEYENRYVVKERATLYYSIIWCIKEAVYKWYAKRGLDFRENMIVHPITISQAGAAVYVEFLKDNKRAVHIAHYQIFNNHIIAYVLAPDFEECAVDIS